MKDISTLSTNNHTNSISTLPTPLVTINEQPPSFTYNSHKNPLPELPWTYVQEKGDPLGNLLQGIIDTTKSIFKNLWKNLPSFTFPGANAITVPEARAEIINRLNTMIDKGTFSLSLDKGVQKEKVQPYYFSVVEAFLTLAQTSEPNFKLAKQCLDKKPTIIILHPK